MADRETDQGPQRMSRAATNVVRSMSLQRSNSKANFSQRFGGLVRTASFAASKTKTDDDSQNLLGPRRETMKVSFPGGVFSESVDDDDDTGPGRQVLKIKEPKLVISRSDDAAKNFICMPHDGFRVDFKAMYTFIKTWKKNDFDIEKEDLKRFFVWYDITKTALFEFFTIEERVVYAWIESKASMPKGMHVRERMVEKLDIIVWGQEIDKVREKFSKSTKPRDHMAQFLEAIENLIVKTLQYFNKKERILPSKLNEAVPEARWVKMEKKIVEEIFKTQQPEYLLLLYMNQTKDLDIWKKSVLSFFQRAKWGKWNAKYEAHLDRIDV